MGFRRTRRLELLVREGRVQKPPLFGKPELGHPLSRAYTEFELVLGAGQARHKGTGLLPRNPRCPTPDCGWQCAG